MGARSFINMVSSASLLSLLMIACSVEHQSATLRPASTATSEPTIGFPSQERSESSVVTATPEPSEISALPSVEVIVDGEGYSELQLHDVHFLWNYNSYLDNFTYVMVDEESYILPFSVPRAGLIYMEYAIPIERITHIACTQETDEVRFISLDNDIHVLQGYPGSWQNNGVSIDVVGIDSSGSEVTIDLSPAAVVNVSFVSTDSVDVEFDPDSYQYLGTSTTWEGESYPIIENLLEPLEFRQGEDGQIIEWENIQKIQVQEDRLAEMIERGLTVTPFWSDAIITLADDRPLEGQIKSQKGYVTGVRQDGILVHMQIFALREISFSR